MQSREKVVFQSHTRDSAQVTVAELYPPVRHSAAEANSHTKPELPPKFTMKGHRTLLTQVSSISKEKLGTFVASEKVPWGRITASTITREDKIFHYERRNIKEL
jgi:hypothetical protein